MKTRESTQKKRISVIEKHALEWSYQQIGEALGISKATAWRIVKRWHDENRVENTARPGRPKKLSKRDARRLRCMTQREPRANLADITGSSGVNVSIRTVGDYLQKQNLYVRVSRQKPDLNQQSRYLRRSFAHRWSGKPKE